MFIFFPPLRINSSSLQVFSFKLNTFTKRFAIYDFENSMADKAIALAIERPDHEAWHIGWPMTETEYGGGMFLGEAKIT